MKKEWLVKTLALVIVVLFICCGFASAFNYDNKSKPLNNVDVLLDDSQLLPPRKEWSCIYDFGMANSVDQTSDNGYIFTGATKRISKNGNDVWLLKTDDKGNEIWDKTFHNKNDDIGHYVQQTNDGGYIIIGGNTDSHGCYDDILLIKTDIEGNEQWIKTFGGPYIDKGVYGQQTNDGGYIIVGLTTIDEINQGSQIWIIKTDGNGNEHWNRTYDGNLSGFGTSIQQTNDNGYIILGNGVLENGDLQILLLKTDENGLVQWNTAYYGQQGLHYYGTKIQQTNDNGYIIMGWVENFNHPDEYVNILLIKTNENGNILWQKTYIKYNWDFCFDGQQTMEGGFILSGITNPPGEDFNDIWIVKTDSNGNMIWNRTIDFSENDHANSIQQTNDNGYIVAGDTCLNSAYEKDAYLIKLAEETKSKPSLIAGTITNLQNCIDYNIFEAKKVLIFQLNPIKFDYYFSNEEIIVRNDKIGLLKDKIVLGIFKSNI